MLIRYLLAILAAAPALGDEVLIIAGRDNTLYETATGSTSNGSGGVMFAGRNSAPTNSIRRAVVWFDVAANIPPGSTIVLAELTLVDSAANTQDEVVALHRLTQDWGEGVSVAAGGGGNGAASAPNDATWVHGFFPSTNWSITGGVFEASASAAQTVGAGGPYTWTSAALAADVQTWLDQPATNFGWIAIGNESAASTAKRFSTREEPDRAARPTLRVVFSAPAVPAMSPGGAIAVATMMAFAATFIARARNRTLVTDTEKKHAHVR